MSFHWNGQAISKEIRRRANMGLKAAVIHLTNRIKETLSVPAPRVRFTDAAGLTYYQAGWLVPRNSTLTGRFQRRTTWKMSGGQLVPKTVVFKPSPATKGAAPRKLSGRLRASWTYEVDEDKLVARSGTNVVYARRHERGAHPFAARTLATFKAEVDTLLGTIDYDSRTVFPNP